MKLYTYAWLAADGRVDAPRLHHTAQTRPTMVRNKSNLFFFIFSILVLRLRLGSGGLLPSGDP